MSGTYTLGTRESATRRGRAFFFITRLRCHVLPHADQGVVFCGPLASSLSTVAGKCLLPCVCSLMSSRRAVFVSARTYIYDQEKDRKQRENHRADFWDHDVDVIDNSKPRSPARPQASTRKPDPCGVVLTARHTPIPPSIAPSFINQFDFESDDDSGQRLRSPTYFRLRTTHDDFGRRSVNANANANVDSMPMRKIKSFV